MSTSPLAERLTRLRLSSQSSCQTPQLLVIVIRLYLASPEILRANNFSGLKYALYLWVYNYPSYKPEELSKEPETKKLHRLHEQLLSYKDFRYISDLVYQICRFLDFGEYYWNEEAAHWNSSYRANAEYILQLVLENL